MLGLSTQLAISCCGCRKKLQNTDTQFILLQKGSLIGGASSTLTPISFNDFPVVQLFYSQ